MARLSAAFVVCFWRASGAFGFWGFREVFSLHEDVFQDEEQRQDVHHGADLFCPAGDGVDGHIGDNSHGDAFGDAVKERHGSDADEGGDALTGILKVDVADRAHHVEAYDDEGRGRGEGRDRQEDRGQQQGQEEQHSGGQGGKSGAAALGYAGGAFYEGGDCGGT